MAADSQAPAGESLFMIAGEDANGDQHMFMTTSLERAVERCRDMSATLRNLRGNDAFEEFARQLV